MFSARWPLYVFEIILSLTAVAMTLAVMRRRGRGWNENLIIVPWLLAQAAFSAYLLLQVIRNGWRDIPLVYVNVLVSNMLLVAGPVCVLTIMVIRLRATYR